MAEIEIGLLVRGCLDRRLGSVHEFRCEVTAYFERKNKNPRPINRGAYAVFFYQWGLMAGLGLQGSKITRINPGR